MAGPEGGRLAAVICTATLCIPATYALLRNIALPECARKLRISDRRLLAQWSGLAALAAASTAITVNAVLLIQREEKRDYYEDLVLVYLHRLHDLGRKWKLINTNLDWILSEIRDTGLVSPEENVPTLLNSQNSVVSDIRHFQRRQKRNILYMQAILHGADWIKVVEDYKTVTNLCRNI